jgi:hypothetical protein
MEDAMESEILPDREEEVAVEAAFVAAFRQAPDKRAFLALACIPLTLPERAEYKLVEVKLTDRFRVGSVSPGFGTREFSYQALPGVLVAQSTVVRFVYVSARGTVEKTLAEIRERPQLPAEAFHV